MMNGYLKSVIIFIFACIISLKIIPATAQDSNCVHQMLIFLQQQQSNGKGHFPKGIFPSYRQYVYRSDILKNDDNLFFTGLIVFTLNEIYPKLSEKNRKIVRRITADALVAFDLYKNKEDKGTYNFWRTNPPKIFPNSGWMNWFDNPQSLPDDFDDTSIGLLAGRADTATVKKIHQYMQHYTNNPKKRIKNTFRRYRFIPAYSVWFGKNFPVDFDLCVLTNTLYLVSAYKLPWTKADSASLRLIDKMIASKDIVNYPAYISPHYHTTAIILYHLSRLMSLKPNLLQKHRKYLIRLAEKQWQMSHNKVEKIMLATALKRWGVDAPKINLPSSCYQVVSILAQSGFVFFIANMAAMLPNPLKVMVSQWGVGQFNYYCPAYNIALMLENIMTDVKKR